MTLGIIFAVMTAAALVAVLWPFGRKLGDRGAGSDKLVYQDQFKEIERDRAIGLIGDAEAESACIEISRRLLAAADWEGAIPQPLSSAASARRRRAASIAVVVVPLFALASYIRLGSPNLPAQSAFLHADAQRMLSSQPDQISRISGPKDRGHLRLRRSR
jgi:cytochrome c-type biogenesis protein CcmH